MAVYEVVQVAIPGFAAAVGAWWAVRTQLSLELKQAQDNELRQLIDEATELLEGVSEVLTLGVTQVLIGIVEHQSVDRGATLIDVISHDISATRILRRRLATRTGPTDSMYLHFDVAVAALVRVSTLAGLLKSFPGPDGLQELGGASKVEADLREQHDKFRDALEGFHNAAQDRLAFA